MNAPRIVTRFAPSPTGYLHLGHAFSALYAFAAAQRAGGTFLLRIEDIDPIRCKPEFTEAIMEDLRWLGLIWPEPVRGQSQHLAEYRQALENLKQRKLVYPCFCTRSEILSESAGSGHAPHLTGLAGEQGPEGPLYPGLCRDLTTGQIAERMESKRGFSWRLDLAKAMQETGALDWHDRAHGTIRATPENFGDVILARKDVPTSYHLSVTVDDHLQGVTLVTRGEDLFATTHIHRLLQALLGYATPAYDHHTLLRDASGKRFAKRDQAVTLRALRASGKSAADVKAMAGF